MPLRSPALREKVAQSNVLCVGAGGIGCELLKTLSCTGFKKITVIDLDTIETSNLNRQFLFRKHHVGQSKAQTAADVVKSFASDVQITALHANVRENRFDVDFLRQFNLVLNGLDNLEARRHVNRLCLAAGLPLVESGTAGYLGQVTIHMKGKTECFECQPKPTPKSFPICTLRNTPDKPIHCVVWAKDLLFQRLFGRPDTVTDLDEPVKDADKADCGDEVAQPSPEDPSVFLRRDGEAALQYAARIFERVFTTDIERVCGMEELWKKRAPPVPLRLSEVLLEWRECSCPPGATSACEVLGLTNPNQKWSVRDSARVFLTSLIIFLEQRGAEVGSAAFDKDDALAVEVVASAAALRSHCYNIPELCLFDAKGMAGNIIHAIATTNAIISGLIVVEALKLLADHAPSAPQEAGTPAPPPNECSSRCSFLYHHASNKRLLVGVVPEGPNPSCMVCGRAQLVLKINTHQTTLQHFINQVVKKRLAVCSPTLMCADFMYEEGEGLEEDEVRSNAALLPRVLRDLPGGGVQHGALLTVEDQEQHFSVDLLVEHQEVFDEEQDVDGFILEGVAPHAKPSTTTDQAGDRDVAGPSGVGRAAAASTVKRDAADIVESIEDGGEVAVPHKEAMGKKRKLEALDGITGLSAAKKAAVMAGNDDEDDVVILD